MPSTNTATVFSPTGVSLHSRLLPLLLLPLAGDGAKRRRVVIENQRVVIGNRTVIR